MRVFSQTNKCQQKQQQQQQQQQQKNKTKGGAPLLGLAKSTYYPKGGQGSL